jgi:hypothetical protein
MMSDNKTVPNMHNSNTAVTLDKDQPVPFTYPEGFNAVANSLQFLPEEARAQTLTGLVMAILLM